jgi:hypothetical protein
VEKDHGSVAFEILRIEDAVPEVNVIDVDFISCVRLW